MMQVIPVLPGTLGQGHEMGEDVLHVHLELADHSHQRSLALEVTVFTRDTLLGQCGSRAFDDAWKPRP